MSSNQQRRRFLAAVGALGATALGGCAGSMPATGDDPETTLTLRLSDEESPLYEGYLYDLDGSLAPWDEKAFEAAISGSEFTTQGHEPFPVRDDPVYVERDGTYYELDSVIVDQVVTTHPVLRLFEVGRSEDLDTVPDHATESSLPDANAGAIRIAQMAARARGTVGGGPGPVINEGGYVYRTEEATEGSRLLAEDGPTHVEYRDVIYRVEVSEEIFHEPVYRPDGEPVAETPEALERIVQATVVDVYLGGDALSQGERDIVRKAEAGGYTAAFPFPDDLESLLRKLDKRAFIDGNITKDADFEESGRGTMKYGDRYVYYRLTLDESSS